MHWPIHRQTHIFEEARENLALSRLILRGGGDGGPDHEHCREDSRRDPKNWTDFH